jgi:transposase InsO family protein
VLSDNGAASIGVVHAVACRRLGIKHLRTRPRRPQTNGKACVSKSGVPSARTVRLPAPVGLTQAKGMSRTRSDHCIR